MATLPSRGSIVCLHPRLKAWASDFSVDAPAFKLGSSRPYRRGGALALRSITFTPVRRKAGDPSVGGGRYRAAAAGAAGGGRGGRPPAAVPPRRVRRLLGAGREHR